MNYEVDPIYFAREYYSTDYRVNPKDGDSFTLRIGEPSPPADAFLSSYGAKSGLFITAFNPFSKQTSEAENQKAMAKLAQELRERELTYVDAEGADEKGVWPPEPSYFVAMDSFMDAVLLTNRFKQNAFVWHRVGKTSELYSGQSGESLWLAPHDRTPIVVDDGPKPGVKGPTLHYQPGRGRQGE